MASKTFWTLFVWTQLSVWLLLIMTLLKSLLNTPGNWLDETDLTRHGLVNQVQTYKKSSNADVLFRYPVDLPTIQDTFGELSVMVATLDLNKEVDSKEQESTLHD